MNGMGRAVLLSEAIAWAAACALRMAYAPPFRASYGDLSLGDGVGSRLAALGKSALALVLPFDPTLCDAFPITPLASVPALFGAAALSGVGLLAMRRGVAAWLFALALLPSLQLVPVMRWWSPHYLYVPLSFGAMLFAEFVEQRFRRPWAVVGTVAALSAVVSWMDGNRFADDRALFQPEVSREPACREGHFFLGEVARLVGEWDEAGEHYERAAAPAPGYLAYADEVAALQNLGAVRLASERWGEARAAWTRALERVLEPRERRRLEHNVATLALRTGDPQEAARLLESEGRRDDALPESLFVLAKALHELGRDNEAREVIQRLKTHPGSPTTSK